MKKVLYLHAGAELYGADIVLLELLKNIDRNIFEPHVILPCNGPLVDKLRNININVEVIPYPILRRKYFNVVGIFQYIISCFKYANNLKKICKDKDINMIHTNTAAVLEGAYIKKILKIPHVWHIHEIIVNPKFMHKILSYIIAKCSNEVVTVSKAVKSHLENTGYFDNEIRVIYNGVDNSTFNSNNQTEYIREELNIPKDSLIVGMIGRVNSWKGQNDFLDAMEQVLDENNNVYAMLVGGVFQGEEWRMDDLKNKIKHMKNSERVILSDYRKDTKNIHALYDVFVLPSTNPDPLPTVVLEAMASGKPIVGYRHGGVCEMVKENYNGLLAEVGNKLDLADKINILVKEASTRDMFGKNSLERQKNMFSLKSYVKNFENLYLHLK